METPEKQAGAHLYRRKHERTSKMTDESRSVSKRLEKKDDHKQRKHKKKKHHKNKDKINVSKSDSSDSDVEAADEWVEKPSSVDFATKVETEKKLERESWMSLPDSFIPTLTKSEMKQKGKPGPSAEALEEERMKRLMLDRPGQHERELNPYWRDGGTGLPTATASSTETKPASQIGDGGYRWLRNAYRRAQEQAKEQNRPLDEIVAERWGSLENLQQLMDDAAKKFEETKGSNDHRRDRRSGGENSYRSHNRQSFHSNTKKSFKQPSMDDEDDHNSSLKMKQERNPSVSGAFLRPKEQEDIRISSSRESSQASSRLQQRWKKKEFLEQSEPTVKSNLAIPAPMPEIDHNSSGSSEDYGNDDHTKQQTKTRSPSPQPLLLSDKEMNELGAKIVKAELMGKNDLANRLKAKLKSANKARESQSDSKAPSSLENPQSKKEMVILTRTDSKGLVRPLPEPEYAGGASRGRHKRQKAETHDKSGQRDRFFADDDKYSLKEMFEREKLGTAEDQNAMFARLAGKSVERTSQDYDIDDVFVTRANAKINEAKVEAQDRLMAINEHKKSTAALESCTFCIDSKHMAKHLIIAIGLKVYLSVPAVQSLTEGHCLIIPMQHVTSATHLDEDVWDEIKIFRKGLTKMFEEQDRDAIFFELCTHQKRFPHMVMHCIPLPNDVGNLAPMYFKKAILESETEWAQNKKLIDLSAKDVRRSVPKGLPYFCVNFGLQGGFAHVIEDEHAFPKSFAQEIIGGMLDLDANAWRHPRHEKFDEVRKKVLQFAEWWKPYDWTERLKE